MPVNHFNNKNIELLNVVVEEFLDTTIKSIKFDKSNNGERAGMKPCRKEDFSESPNACGHTGALICGHDQGKPEKLTDIRPTNRLTDRPDNGVKEIDGLSDSYEGYRKNLTILNNKNINSLINKNFHDLFLQFLNYQSFIKNLNKFIDNENINSSIFDNFFNDNLKNDIFNENKNDFLIKFDELLKIFFKSKNNKKIFKMLFIEYFDKCFMKFIKSKQFKINYNTEFNSDEIIELNNENLNSLFLLFRNRIFEILFNNYIENIIFNDDDGWTTAIDKNKKIIYNSSGWKNQKSINNHEINNIEKIKNNNKKKTFSDLFKSSNNNYNSAR